MTVETLIPREQLLDAAPMAAFSACEDVSHGSASADTEAGQETVLQGPYERMMGDTEHNWCRSVAGGTGITVLGFLFSRPLDCSNLQLAIDMAQIKHPRLRSQLVWIHGRPAFQVCSKPCVKVEVLDATAMATNQDDGTINADQLNENSKLAVSGNASGDDDQSHVRQICSGSRKQGKEMVMNGEVSCQVGYEEQENETVSQAAAHIPFQNSSSELRLQEKVAAENSVDASSVQEQIEGPFSNPEISIQADEEERGWLTLVEDELNTNLWLEHDHCLDPVQMFIVRVYHLPHNRSLMILRVHTASCDRMSASTIVADILGGLLRLSKGHPPCPEMPHDVQTNTSALMTEVVAGKFQEAKNGSEGLMSVEDTIPPGKANKPFWAHGIDLLGYSLGSRRHAVMPFEEPNLPRRTELIRSSLSFERTQALLQACSKVNTSLYGAMCAAGLKAAAAAKKLGNHSEHFAIVSLIDLRRYFEPALPDSTVGFYNSALMNTHHLNERTEFWELAKRCSSSLDNVMKNRKHFTDMGDLNFLMYQAMTHPHLTPSGSLRTSLLVVFKDTISDSLGEVAEALGIEDSVGCSSIHGIGPSLAVFHSIQNGKLHCANVYPAPLHSRAQMRIFINKITDILIDSLPNCSN